MNPEKDKIYVVGNWKMNPASVEDAETIFDEMENDFYKMKTDRVEAVICMPCVFLSEFDSDGKIKLGAQNVFWENCGAYTGEISPEMLRRVGAKYVIVGHSERRMNLGETDKMINLKIKAALAGGLRPVLCVGENMEEKTSGNTGEVVIKQIENALDGISGKEIAGKLLIAYEPVWAISTNGYGMTPSADEIMSAGLIVKKVLAKICTDREIVDSVPILYGGSVTSQNAFDFVDKTGLNGLLVGGASLKPNEFVGIIKEFAE